MEQGRMKLTPEFRSSIPTTFESPGIAPLSAGILWRPLVVSNTITEQGNPHCPTWREC